MKKSRKDGKIYAKIFEKWNTNRTPLTLKGEDFTYIPEPGEEFRQCYLADTEKNRQQRFYKARHGLPKNWWVSDQGTIIRVIGNKKDGYRVALYYGQGGSRLQVRIKKDVYPREAIVGLAFADKLPLIDEMAAECIEKKGLTAFRRNRKGTGVEVHHCSSYVPFNTRTEAMRNLKVNCNPKNIRFLLSKMHDILAHMQPCMKRLYSGTETLEDIHALSEEISRANIGDRTTTFFPGESGRQGDITTFPPPANVNVKFKNNTSISLQQLAEALHVYAIKTGNLHLTEKGKKLLKE